jgi:hypothetical protein
VDKDDTLVSTFYNREDRISASVGYNIKSLSRIIIVLIQMHLYPFPAGNIQIKRATAIHNFYT